MKNYRNKHTRNGLSALRGIGISGIVLYHLFPSVFPGGFLGVPLFFVLSGYLMFVTSEACWRKGTFRIGQYYKKRLQKIIPPLFTMVMVICCYMTLTKSSLMAGIRQEICSIFLGYNNWWQIGRHASYFSKLAASSPFTHLWFLAVEIQFYIIWPFLFILYKKGCRIIGARRMCFFFLLLACLSAGKMLFLYTPGTDPSRVYYGTDTMAFPLLIGIFLGAARRQYKSILPPAKGSQLAIYSIFIPVICLLFVMVDGQSRFLYQGGMFFLSILFSAVINMIENREGINTGSADNSLLSLLGRKSYWIYLWHYPLIILALV